MSATNIYTPARYDERVWHLAVGVEARSATTGRRISRGTDVRLERRPAPLHKWRRWRPGETVTAELPRLRAHPSGRFSRRYDDPPALSGPTTTLRVVDSPGPGSGAGRGRRFVPRRVSVTVADEATVLAAEADPTSPPHPLWERIFPLAVFPGATADIPTGAAVLRGRVVRVTDPTTGEVEPVRWCRVRAVDGTGDEVGWAHGDDRGEFVLVVTSPEGALVVPPDPLPIELTVGAATPPPTPDPAEPLLVDVDPLWDLPLEPLTASADPATEPTLSGRAFLAGQTQSGPFPVNVPAGRESTVQLTVT